MYNNVDKNVHANKITFYYANLLFFDIIIQFL